MGIVTERSLPARGMAGRGRPVRGGICIARQPKWREFPRMGMVWVRLACRGPALWLSKDERVGACCEGEAL